MAEEEKDTSLHSHLDNYTKLGKLEVPKIPLEIPKVPDWASGHGYTPKMFFQYLKVQIHKLDPRIVKVGFYKNAASDIWEINVKFNDGASATLAIASNILDQAGSDEKELSLIADSLVKDLKYDIETNHPLPKTVSTYPKNVQYIVDNLGHHILKDVKPILKDEEWQAMIVAQAQKIIHETASNPTKLPWEVEGWNGAPSYKPPPPYVPVKAPLPPTPPEKDKEYYSPPEYEYQKTLEYLKGKTTKNYLISDTWGSLKSEIIAANKKLLEDAANNKAPYKPYSFGFDGTEVQDNLRHVLPCLYQKVKCPVCGMTSEMSQVIIELNDEHDWTREAIADWAESLDIDISVKGEDNEQDGR